MGDSVVVVGEGVPLLWFDDVDGGVFGGVLCFGVIVLDLLCSCPFVAACLGSSSVSDANLQAD